MRWCVQDVWGWGEYLIWSVCVRCADMLCCNCLQSLLFVISQFLHTSMGDIIMRQQSNLAVMEKREDFQRIKGATAEFKMAGCHSTLAHCNKTNVKKIK